MKERVDEITDRVQRLKAGGMGQYEASVAGLIEKRRQRLVRNRRGRKLCSDCHFGGKIGR